MATSYSKFTIEDLNNIGIEVIEAPLFVGQAIAPVAPTDYLKITLERNVRRKLRSEKAKSEFIISPILADLEEKSKGTFACFSGYPFNVDAKLGLRGFCDYIFSLKSDAVVIEAPVFCVVEAKNDNLDEGMAQCIAEMYAAQIFNERKKRPTESIYGVVTFGFEWKFVLLHKKKATIDTNIYYLNELPKILGIMEFIIKNAATN
jgi:hypothetical protein